MIYKEIDLFGGETVRVIKSENKRRNLFTEYDEFVGKFEPKRTTDDCYTPPDVYDLILRYVAGKFDISEKRIIRPFFPGGDYEAVDYSGECVVIDNPPFSIISSVARFYIDRKIPFFLFAPHLTLFGSDIDCTHVVVGADIVYENGAEVKTSFLSNMLGDIKILGDADLYAELEALRREKRTPLPKYRYPANVVTVSSISWIVEKGISIEIPKSHARHWRTLDSQRPHGKSIFGSGFLVSEKAAAEKAAAEKAAAEKINEIEWSLSRKELEVIKRLG